MAALGETVMLTAIAPDDRSAVTKTSVFHAPSSCAIQILIARARTAAKADTLKSHGVCQAVVLARLAALIQTVVVPASAADIAVALNVLMWHARLIQIVDQADTVADRRQSHGAIPVVLVTNVFLIPTAQTQ